MTRGPLASGIMPSHRGPKFIERAIRSWQEQTYSNRELVIVSAYSDAINVSQGIARCHNFEEYKRTKVIYGEGVELLTVPNATSLGEMRNVACRKASGSILVHVDDDDWSHPTRLERSVEAIRKGAMLVGSSKTYMVKAETKEMYLYDGNKQPKEETCRLYGATIAYRRELWEKMPFDPFKMTGEENHLIRSAMPFTDLNDPELVYAWVDNHNTSRKTLDRPLYAPVPWVDGPWSQL